MDTDSQAGRLLTVAEALHQHDHFLLAGHVDPDPDCIGSLLALAWALRRLGKVCQPVVPDPPQPAWRFLPGIEALRQPHEVQPAQWQTLVVIDCELNRTGPVAQWASGFSCYINIDHHVTNPADAPVQLLDPHAAAAGEIVYNLIRTMGLTPDPDAATLLYTAIMTDTGSFRFSNTSAKVLQVGATLVQLGAQPDLIARNIYETHSWDYLQLLQKVLATMSRSADGRIAWITISAADLHSDGTRKDETEGLIQYPRMVAGVEVALAFRELGSNQVRVGLRSKQTIDVSRIARQLGGGGHVRAAGCTLQLPLEQARAVVLAQVEEAVRSSLE